jgi:osmotically-inducible protein OsmY
MKSDQDLKKDVQDAISWDPLLYGATINAAVTDGTVTLTGSVDSYIKKITAEYVAQKIIGVKNVVEKIQITFDHKNELSDTEIEAMISNTLKWNWGVSDKKLNISVLNGWVTIEGEQQWDYQKEAAKNAIINLIGVKGVTNNIILKSKVKDEIEKKDIQRALGRNWSMNNLDIQIKITGNMVTLTGTVHSFYQKYEAARIVFNAPGVWTVDNELTIA